MSHYVALGFIPLVFRRHKTLRFGYPLPCDRIITTGHYIGERRVSQLLSAKLGTADKIATKPGDLWFSRNVGKDDEGNPIYETLIKFAANLTPNSLPSSMVKGFQR